MRIFPFQLAWIFLATSLFVPSGTAEAASCSIVARVLQSSSGNRFKPGDGLCQGQTFSSSTPIRVACTGARKVLWLQKPDDLSQCKQSYPSFRGCLINSRVSCKIMRNDQAPKPFLIQPYGYVLAKSPSELKWTAIDNADSYQINIIGDKTWKFSSTQSYLKILSIASKNTIQIIIEAFAKKRLLSTSTTTFNLLDQKQIKTINADLTLIDSLRSSTQEKISLKLSVFSDLNLLNESISLISKEIFLRPNNPLNIRLLGDIYLESGLIDEANETYIVALKKADKAQDKTEISRSKWGLEQVLAFRLMNDQKTSN
jgi:hypothetical protein